MAEPLQLYILASVLVFIVGSLIGVISTKRKKLLVKSKIQLAIAIIITLVWLISIAAEIIIPAYTVSVLVHGIMGAVVGYLFSEDGLTINIGGE